MTLYETVYAERFGRPPRRKGQNVPESAGTDSPGEALRAYFAREITLAECADRLHALGVERIELTDLSTEPRPE